MELVGRDPDFRAESELAAVGKARGNVVKHARGIDRTEKSLRCRFVASDDDVGVVRAVFVDV